MMNTNDYMTVQRLLGRLEGLATGIERKNLENEICNIVECLDDTIDRYAPADSFPAAGHQNEPTWEEALKGFHAIKAFCAERKQDRCRDNCPFWPACQVWDKPPEDWPEPEEAKAEQEARLRKLETQAKEAAAAANAAEREAKELKAKLAMASTDMAEFKAHFETTQGSVKRMLEVWSRIRDTDQATAEKCRQAILAVARQMEGKVGA